MRLRETRKFQLSGFKESEKAKVVQLIVGLKGHYLESKSNSQEYISESTHIICAQPTRSEKYLCACAAGKWILTKEYVIKSYKVGEWLDEKEYEWGNVATNITKTPKHWREYTERTGKRAFSNWVVALAVENLQRRPAVYKRLLQTGGAKVVNLATAVAESLTHIIVDKDYSSEVKKFAKAGVLCVLPAYLGEVLLEESPNVENFLAVDASLVVKQLPRRNSRNGRFVKSPCKSKSDSSVSSLSSEKMGGTVTKITSCTSSLIDNRRNTTSKTDGCPAMQNVVTRGNSGTKLQSCSATKKPSSLAVRSNSETKSSYFSPKKTPTPVKERLSRKAIKLKKEESSPIRDNNNILKYCSPEKRQFGIKRKRVLTENDVRDALRIVKRKKIETPAYSVCNLHVFPKPTAVKKLCAVPFHCLTTNIIDGAIEEDEWLDAVHMAQISISAECHPPAHILHIFMQEMLVTTNKSLPPAIYHLLKTCLCIHPPTSNHALYLDSFTSGAIAKRPQNGYVHCDTAWDFIDHVIKQALDQATNIQTGHSLFLQYVVALFDKDFSSYCDQWKNKEKLQPGFEKSMLTKVLWPRGPVKPTASNMRRLMCYLVQAVVKTSNSHECVRLLQTLFGMAAECCRIAQAVQPEALSSGLANEGLSSELIREMVSRLMQSDVLNNRQCLKLYLSTLTISWVKLLSITTMLSYYDSGLVSNRNIQAEKLSLDKIVKWYFYLLPQMGSRKSPKKDKTPKKTSSPGTKTNTDHFKINKRNGKGETSLQVACIKGHLARVKELLSVPGIDVNSQDNAGWTALHEACNKGNVACVRELLRFKPTKTIMHYFDTSKATAQSSSINLLISPPCGTTPLHDAVVNGRTEIALMLIQHGGKKLLTIGNKDGYTPLDYANTAEMKKILLACDKENNNVIEAPSPRASFKEYHSFIPDEECYRKVLGDPNHQPDFQDRCGTMVFLISELLNVYIASNDLPNLQREVNFAHSLKRHGDVRQESSTKSESDLIQDLCVYSQINDHVDNFNKHLRRICENGHASLALKWAEASVLIGDDEL
ncbi:SMC5-SMC6 complex localization factor protein 1-like [Antedon mediterranea]|uniref:SMC5-SMC6 complex localization factor protein 1-like n=1 Tax=Antedon mediterranea TaxID=105859 RepID=UPI003AF43911